MNKEMFLDVIIYTVSEPGAMGIPSFMECVKKNGEKFSLNYGGDDYYSKIKENFPAIEGCFWNGPMPGDKTSGEIVFFVNDDEKNAKATRVAKGWKHIYTGCGNHLVVKEEYYSIFKKHINDLTNPEDIYCYWQERLDDILKEINENVD